MIYFAMRHVTRFYIDQIPLSIASGHALAAEACKLAALEALTDNRRYCTDWSEWAEDCKTAISASAELDKFLETSRGRWVASGSALGAYAPIFCHPN